MPFLYRSGSFAIFGYLVGLWNCKELDPLPIGLPDDDAQRADDRVLEHAVLLVDLPDCLQVYFRFLRVGGGVRLGPEVAADHPPVLQVDQDEAVPTLL